MTDDLSRFAPPDVPLRLTAHGPGSRQDIIDYVRRVIEQRTTVNDDTSADRLARGLVTSILSRLGAGYSIAAGQATVGLVPRIIASDAVPPDTIFVIAPSPVDDPKHPDYVPVERRAVKIKLDPEE